MAFSKAPQPRFVLNVAPVDLPDAEIVVGRQPFESPEQYRALRNTYRGTYIFKRRGDTIVDVPIVQNAKPLGSAENMPITDDLGIAGALVQEAYLRHLLSLKRVILDCYPLEFLGDENLLVSSLDDKQQIPDWIGVYLRYEISLRTLFAQDGEPFLALALGIRTANVINATCDVLLGTGVDIRQRYIQEAAQAFDPRVASTRILLGRVLEVRGGDLVLCDSRDQRNSASASTSYLEPRRENLRLCLRVLCGATAEATIQRLDGKVSHVVSGRERLKKARDVFAYLGRQRLELVPGLDFGLGAVLDKTSKRNGFPATSLERGAVYVFDHGAHTSTWHDRGLSDFGPYDQRTFTPSRPAIAVICQAAYRGETEQFIRKLMDGLPNVTDYKGRAPFGQGLQRKYCLDKCQVEFFDAANGSGDAYRSAIGRAIDSSTDRKGKWDIAIVQTEERFHNFTGDDNPYLVSKGLLLLHGVPSQEVEIETMRVPELSLTYVLNNVALACYAKLGGVPWLLQANRAIAHELVVGLGSASLGTGRLSERNRVVGITTVFTGDGNYLLENRTKAVSMDEYPDALVESLRATIASVKQSLNWQPRDSVRVVFHAFKPFRWEQIDSVKKVLDDLQEFEVQFAFVHVKESHPYLLFDEAQSGVLDSQSRTRKGQCAPTRGYWLRLNDHESLLVLTGAREVKRPEDGLPRPVLLQLDRSSTFRDIGYLTRQVYHFSCHSWRSFFPAPMPITIFYSELIAGLLGNLSGMKKWDAEALRGQIGRTRWFL